MNQIKEAKNINETNTLVDTSEPHSIEVEMQNIMQAIAKRDPEAARQACVGHVQAAGAIALKQINNA